MQRLPSTGRANRPTTLQSKSFTRFEPRTTSPTARARSNTLPESPVLTPSGITISIPPLVPPQDTDSDIFERHEEDNGSDGGEDSAADNVSEVSAELPIEIQSMTETFLESLGAKVHPTPLSIDKLSQLFQDFYEHANEHINGHIAFLATRSPSEPSPTPSVSSAGSTPSAVGGRKGSRPVRSGGKSRSVSTDQQMLTPSEIAGRRKSRRVLEQKRVVMEEALERSICEKVYPRIWRHRSTDDEARDEKLQSRAAALALVGVDLRELLSTAMGNDIGSASQLKLDEAAGDSAEARLAGARQSLQRMDQDRYPLGKLNHLKAVHKSIVDTLQQISTSNSSADEVLPTLIFTLITSNQDSNHVVSNFNFIQRFRASSKIDGEAAYCLTNLEAAITFLETVDLSSLRSDETPGGPARAASHPPTPRTDTPDPMDHGMPSGTSSDTSETTKDQSNPPSAGRGRGVNVLTQPRPRHFEVQSDVVLRKADEAFDTIHNAMDNSFKFLFGRLRERQGSTTPQHDDIQVANPKTLEDARKLISSPSPAEDEASIDSSSNAEQADDTAVLSANPEKVEDGSTRVLQMIGGRRARDRSVDSGNSPDNASRKVSFAEDSSPTASISGKVSQVTSKPLSGRPKGDDIIQAAPPLPLTSPTTASAPPASLALPSSASAYAAVESMRTLGTTLNPLRGLTGMGMMRGFGRNAPGSGGTPSAASATMTNPLEQAGGATKEREQVQERQVKAKGNFSLSGVAPPVQRFMDCKEVRQLTGFEVELLLRDYQRLAGVLRALRESERET